MAGLSTLVTAFAVAAAAAPVLQASEARKARKAGEAAAAAQYAQQEKLMNMEKENQRKLEEDNANAAATALGNQNRDAAKRRAKAGSAGSSGGMKQNVLTSPLGTVTAGATAGKTALGT